MQCLVLKKTKNSKWCTTKKKEVDDCWWRESCRIEKKEKKKMESNSMNNALIIGKWMNYDTSVADQARRGATPCTLKTFQMVVAKSRLISFWFWISNLIMKWFTESNQSSSWLKWQTFFSKWGKFQVLEKNDINPDQLLLL